MKAGHGIVFSEANYVDHGPSYFDTISENKLTLDEYKLKYGKASFKHRGVEKKVMSALENATAGAYEIDEILSNGNNTQHDYTNVGMSYLQSNTLNNSKMNRSQIKILSN